VTLQQIASMIQAGLSHHQQGRLNEAEALYRRALQADPDNAQALHFLGLAVLHRNKPEDAISLISRAARLAPGDATIQHNFGIVLRDSGDTGRAIIHYRKAIAASPDYSEAHNNLGVALREMGRHDEALVCFQKAVSLKPAFFQALANAGAELSERRRHDEALVLLRQALGCKPDYVPALSTLGAVLNSLSRPEEGVLHLERAIALQPEFVEAHFNYAVVLRVLDRADEAERQYRFVLERRPGFAQAHANLGVLNRARGLIDLSRANFERAMALDPALCEPYLGLAGLEISFGDPVHALELFEEARKRKPAEPEVLYMRAIGLLRSGRLQEGWKDFDYRHEVIETGVHNARRQFIQPEWSGGVLHGKSLLVWGEQGIGDEIWAAGMYLELMHLMGPGNRLVVEGAAKLRQLFERSLSGNPHGVEVVFAARSDPSSTKLVAGADCQIAGASLGRYLRKGLADFPKREQTGGAYLFADLVREAHWRRRMKELGPQLKVGIGWRSSNLRGERALSCSRLSQWGDIFKVSGVDFINVQYGDCEAELREAEALFGVEIKRFPEVDMYDDLDETAALMRGLDLVISAPTSVSILSAALGIPTWQMNFGAEWQCHGLSNNPWYPLTRNFARRWDQPWEEIIKKIAGELSAMPVKSAEAGGVE
jgi:tetratricopeptide (TPR) repeat protein